MIPCRVCGKLFEPCAYCQTNADVFRWRNFACSRECAKKYIDDTIAYRESLNSKKEICDEKEVVENTSDKSETDTFKRKKKNKDYKKLVNESENIEP